MIQIGIDPGTHTGLALWDDEKRILTDCKTLPIHKALKLITELWNNSQDIFVIFEDARQRKWYTGNVSAKAQGAGSIKRDCTIWEDFLTDSHIPFRAVPPTKGVTKWDEDYFRRVTGYDKKTSEHARDAALLVFGR